MFDENTLLAEVTEKWGEHGAHADVLRHLITLARETERLREANAALITIGNAVLTASDHDKNCGIVMGRLRNCDCGYDDLWSRWVAAT